MTGSPPGSTAEIGEIFDLPASGDDESFGIQAGYNPGSNGQGYSFTDGTWSGPVPVGSSPPLSLYVTVDTNGPKSARPDSKPIQINANLTLAAATPLPGSQTIAILPAGTANLLQAAGDLGYLGFAWEQRVTTVPFPSPLAGCANVACSLAISLAVPFNDPPLNGYYNNGKAPSPNTYPFAYPGLISDLTTETGSNVLAFGDSPNDVCILGPHSQPSQGYYNAIKDEKSQNFPLVCGDPATFAPSDSALSFTTELVGITGTPSCMNMGDCPVLDSFTWTDDFNGNGRQPSTGTGGIGGNFDSLISADPTTGTGGIVIVSENGMPVSEPPTIFLIISGITLLTFCKRAKIVPRRCFRMAAQK